MNRLKAHWLIDLLLIGFAVCLFLPVYIINGQYARANAAVGKAKQEAQAEAGDNPEKYVQILAEKTRNQESPEIFYRRQESVGRFIFWLFLLLFAGSLASRRWVSSAAVLIFWMLSWSLHGVRY
jgi:hypothetical protein